MTTTSSTSPATRGRDVFTVGSRIGRAVGVAGRYACDAVRALPGPKRDQVILQATDGHQATCLLAPGNVTAPRLVPASVLPTRRSSRQVHVRLQNGQWQSTEGRLADDSASDATFPPVADVLPVIGGRPFYETAGQAERRRAATQGSRDKAAETPESMHLVLGIDVGRLSKLAEGLGTPKLTLFVPVPIRRRGERQSPEQMCVNRAVAVCPADRPDDAAGPTGLGVVMPLQPDQTAADYARARQIIVEAERRITDRKRRAG